MEDSAAGTKKSKRTYLFDELKQIKGQLYSKLQFFKARSQGVAPSTTHEDQVMSRFDIPSDLTSIEAFVKKEIDYLFAMCQTLNSVMNKGDETYKVMRELAKLTEDSDSVSLEIVVKRLQKKF